MSGRTAANRKADRNPFSRGRADASGSPRRSLHPAAEWLLERMGFDPAALEASRDASRLVDPDLAVEIVASELAEAHFQTVVNTIDDRLDGAAAMGRIMSCIYVEHTTDWPMQRSWYHDLYLTLARIEGCLGIDVSSDCMQERAVKHYLREMRALVNAHVLARDALRSAGHAEDTEELLARPPASPQLRLL